MITDITSRMSHKFSEVICVKCGKRWISVRPSFTLLKELECPSCHLIGYTVETGENVQDDETIEKEYENNIIWLQKEDD